MPHKANLPYLRIVLTDPDLIQCQLAVPVKLSGGGQPLTGLVIVNLEHPVTDLGEAVDVAHERVLPVPPDLEVDAMLQPDGSSAIERAVMTVIGTQPGLRPPQVSRPRHVFLHDDDVITYVLLPSLSEEGDELILIQHPAFVRMLMEVLQGQMHHGAGEGLDTPALRFQALNVSILILARALLEAAQRGVGMDPGRRKAFTVHEDQLKQSSRPSSPLDLVSTDSVAEEIITVEPLVHQDLTCLDDVHELPVLGIADGSGQASAHEHGQEGAV